MPVECVFCGFHTVSIIAGPETLVFHSFRDISHFLVPTVCRADIIVIVIKIYYYHHVNHHCQVIVDWNPVTGPSLMLFIDLRAKSTNCQLFMLTNLNCY